MKTGSKGFIGATGNTANPFSGGGGQNNARALGSIGRALSQAGSAGLQIAGELQQAKNAKVVAEAQNNWDTSLSDFRADVMKNPNPESWIGDFDSKAADWKQKALGADYMPPDVKNRLENDWLRFHGRSRNKLMMQASSLMVEQAKGAIGLRMDKAIDSANNEELKGIVKQGREDGLLSKVDADKALYRGGKEIKARQFKILLEDDPQAALDSIKKFGFSEHDEPRYQKQAELAIKRNKAEDAQKIVAGYEAGVLDFGSAMEAIEASGLDEVESKRLAKSLQSNEAVSEEVRLDFMEKIRELEEGASEMSSDTYTEKFLQLRQDSALLGRRPNADYVQREVDKISPDRLKAANEKGLRIQKEWKEHQLEERMKFSMAHWTDHGANAFKKIEEATGEDFPKDSAKMEFDREMRKYYKNGGGETKLESEQKAFQVMESIYLDFVDDGFIGSAPGAKVPQAKASPSGTHKSRSDIPYNGTPANVRYNNPAAAYPRKSDEKYGILGYGVLNGGKQGMHKIGRFPSPVHGAAANLDLFADKYVGMTAHDAVRKWRGNGGRGEKVVVPKGYDPNMKITKDFLNDPDQAIDFFKKMAMHESPGFKGMSNQDWRSSWEMWKSNQRNA